MVLNKAHAKKSSSTQIEKIVITFFIEKSKRMLSLQNKFIKKEL